jgi:hypothetical protein
MESTNDCGTEMVNQNDEKADRRYEDGRGCAGDKRSPQKSGALAPPLVELDQLVTAERLREILWDERSRPSLQWVRKETKRRMLPHLRRGRLIFYRPRSVMEWFSQRESRPTSMK